MPSSMARTRPIHRARERLIVVGNGMAGLRLVEELIALAPRRYDIVVVGKEPRPAYNRVLLSSLLAGHAEAAEIELKPRSWYAENGIELLCGVPAIGLRRGERRVILGNGTSVAYDRLVLATGSNAIRLLIPGHDLSGVITFRDLADVEALRAAEPGSRAVVIGGGLLGIEAAYGLARRGVAVALLHLMPWLMERQLDAAGAALLKAAIEKLGIEVVLEADTAAIEGGGKVEGVVLKDGRAFPAELVVMATGVRPETTLAGGSGIEIGRGFLVDDKLETNWPSVYAIGECAEHRGACYGLVEPAYEQAKGLARYLAGLPGRYQGSLLATSLKVSGVPVFSIGDFDGNGAETVLYEDPGAAVYRKLVIREGRLVGAVLVGDTAEQLWYRDLVRQRAPVAPIRAALAFGKAYAEAA
jgi:nitrite reductase (NADH) large subunit